jgi:hypothetical protein
MSIQILDAMDFEFGIMQVEVKTMPIECPPQADLISVGKLAEILQASPRVIEQAAQAAGVMPSLRLNGILYFADGDTASIRAKLDAR